MKAILLLHEIYGVNGFLQEQRQKLCDRGYDAYCMDLYGGKRFAYGEGEEAYAYFRDRVGFDAYTAVLGRVAELKRTHEKVCLVGFSVGATLAWRCAQAHGCDGVIGFYGSRIRDYLQESPVCPALLLFAEEDSFDVVSVAETLRKRSNTTVESFPAGHGFMDAGSPNYDERQAALAERKAVEFLQRL